ncbi:hypothetical protein EBR03_08445 [bacterium]|nr:hypothetical protein [bacterium]
MRNKKPKKKISNKDQELTQFKSINDHVAVLYNNEIVVIINLKEGNAAVHLKRKTFDKIAYLLK